MPNFNLNTSFGYFTHGHVLNYSEFRKYYYEIDMQRTSSYELDVNTQWNILSNLNLISGFYRRTTLGILQISDFDYYGLNYGDGKAGLPDGDSYSTNALYTQLTYAPIEKITLVGGLRFEHLDAYNMYYARGVISEDSTDNRLPDNTANRTVIEAKYKPENNGYTFVPRVALIYNPLGKHYFKLLYGEARKQPSFSENYRQLPKNRPQLKTSGIKTIEFNYYSTLLGSIVINSSVFYNQLENLINATNVYNSTTGEWDIYSYNSGKLTTLGIELDIKYQINKKLSIEFSGTKQNTKDLRTGYDTIDVAYSPHYLAYGKALYNFSNNSSAAILFNYVDQMETEWETESTPDAGSRLARKTNSYLVTDLNIRKENIFDKNIYINLKINNLFNKKYRYPTTNSNAWIDKGVPGDGISFLASAGIKF